MATTMNYPNVKKVIVVCKTHLDIGFTDYSQTVLDQYCSVFIPGALELARKVNTPNQKRFVWTVGSFLPAYFLSTANDAQKENFKQAVQDGHLRWHRMACTTHTELMDADLFEYSLSLAEKLNEQFGLTGIAAKMTDVPGHTIAMVPLLADHGIQYLHLGVNQSSRLPNVPAMFRWQFQGKEIIVHYAGGYGADLALDNGIALEFFHTNDNAGPPSLEALENFYADMADKYPNAQIEAGTLDDFAESLLPIKDTLPVITQEIGDTWIHGAGTDPLKVSRFRRLLKLRKEWISKGLLNTADTSYEQMMMNLLLITEHTWGMDSKLHLLDYTNWTKKDFIQARQNNRTTHAMMAFREREDLLAEKMRPKDPVRLAAGSSYEQFERSHEEQRNYLKKAMELLSDQLLQETEKDFTWTLPCTDAVTVPKQSYQLHNWTATLGEHGEIVHLENPDINLSTNCCIGLFSYETFSGHTVQNCLEDYGRDLDEHRFWAEFDFGKPGLQYIPEIKDQTWYASPVSAKSMDNCLTIFLETPADAAEEHGCPRRIVLTHIFEENRIHTTLYWTGKDACRAPESLWLSMNPLSGHPDWEICKMGQWLSPTDVVSGGNRQLHCIEGIRSANSPANFKITSLDAPLVSVGRKNIYHVDDVIEDCGNGFWFNLYNNRWGTNFKQWFEEDMRFEFVMEITIN